MTKQRNIFRKFLLLLMIAMVGNVWGQPTLYSPGSSGGTTIYPSGSTTFSWSTVSGATSYTLQIYEDDCDSDPQGPFTNTSGFTGSNLIYNQNVGNITSVNYTLTAGRSYAWAVKSNNSSYSNRYYVKVALDAPTLNSPNNGATVSSPITFNWANNSMGNSGCGRNVNQYRLHISTSSSFNNQTGLSSPNIFDQNVGNVTSYNPGSIFTSGTTYYWTVKGASDIVSSKYAQVQSFTVAASPSLSVSPTSHSVSASGGNVSSTVTSNVAFWCKFTKYNNNTKWASCFYKSMYFVAFNSKFWFNSYGF